MITVARVYLQAPSPDRPGGNIYFNKLLSLALRDSGLFEAMVALSQCHLQTTYKVTRPDQESLYHRGKALTSLRTTVSSSGIPSDATIGTAIALAYIDVSDLLALFLPSRAHCV